MSFTMTVKNEAIHIERIKTEILSELSALFFNSAEIFEIIKINTENVNVARYIYEQIKKIYDVRAKITVRKGYNFNKSYIYILEISKRKDDILKDLGIIKEGKYLEVPPNYMVEDEDLMGAYLRGLFLSSGSINDPKTSRYHLEFLVSTQVYADFISHLLNKFSLNSKVIKRENKYMIYIKEAEKISDFLKLIKTTNAVLYYENIRIYRDQKNMTNRLNNCEQANVDKMIETAHKQIRDIQYLKEKDVFDLLDEKVKEVAHYREKYPEVSLLELSEILSLETGYSITKSGVHHRLKKIENFASKVRDQK